MKEQIDAKEPSESLAVSYVRLSIRNFLNENIKHLDQYSEKDIRDYFMKIDHELLTDFFSHHNECLSSLINAELSLLANETVEFLVKESLNQAVEEIQSSGKPISKALKDYKSKKNRKSTKRILPSSATVGHFHKNSTTTAILPSCTNPMLTFSNSTRVNECTATPLNGIEPVHEKDSLSCPPQTTQKRSRRATDGAGNAPPKEPPRRYSSEI